MRLGDRDLQLLRLALAHQLKGRDVTDGRASDEQRQFARIDDRCAVEGGDYVAALDAGRLRGAALKHLGNQGTGGTLQPERFGNFRRHLLDVNPEPSAHYFARVAKLREFFLDDIYRNRETDSHVGAGAGVNRRVDADHFASDRYQRPA